MQIRFYATLRPIVGGKTVEIADPANQSIRIILDGLIAQYPPLGPALFDAENKLHHHVHVFVNGRDTHYLEQGLDSVLTVRDRVDIFPPVGGGDVAEDPPVAEQQEEPPVSEQQMIEATLDLPEIDMTLTAVPLWLLRQYLVEIGGRAKRGGRVMGDGWTARLTQVDDYVIGSLRVGRVRMILDGDKERVDALRPLLDKMLVRGGG